VLDPRALLATDGLRGLAALMFLASLSVGRLFRRSAIPQAIHRRGAVVSASRAMKRPVARRRAARGSHPICVGGFAIPEQDEAKHFKFLGTTGTGKTTAIRELLRNALDRGDRAVVTDPSGAYLERFYERYRGDVILNPFEPRSARWNPFLELRSAYDYEELARGLIPQSDDSSGREWRGYARTFVAALLRRCNELGLNDVGQLWRLLAVATSGEVRSIVEGTPAEPFLDPDNARMFGSIRSVAVSACAAVEHLRCQRGVPFSIRDWAQSGRGALFIPYWASQVSALRAIIATWVRTAIFEILSEPPDESRRLWFVVDELDALGAIDGLKDALARLRKFGGRCVLGFQSLAQVSSTYGSEAQTIVENCGNTVILRCAGSEHGGTSQFASRLIGEREILRRHTAYGRDRGPPLSRRGMRLSTHVSEHVVTESAVLASELEQLPDLAGFLKTASSAQWLRVRLTRESDRWRSITSG
jgi:Type IV secretion-system coupling protein DNA-binding domain